MIAATAHDVFCVHAVAAIVATRNDTELRELFDGSASLDLSFFSNSTASQFLRHFLLKGVLQDAEVLQKRLRRLLGDATFLQAFAHSGAPGLEGSQSLTHPPAAQPLASSLRT